MSDDTEKKELPDIEETITATEQAATEEEKAGLTAATESAEPGSSGLDLIMEVPLRLSVEVGSASLPVRDVLALAKGSIVELDRMSGEPADVYANDRLIARGELTVQEDRVAVRVTELIAVKAAANAD